MIASNISLDFIKDNIPEKYDEIREIYDEYFIDYNYFDLGRSMGVSFSVKDYTANQLLVFRSIDNALKRKK